MANEAFAAEILAMADEDQRMRREVSGNTQSWDPSVDQRNARLLREIVGEIGWPTTSKVGAQAEHAAWLLAQHAEIEFQKDSVALMAREPAEDGCTGHL